MGQKAWHRWLLFTVLGAHSDQPSQPEATLRGSQRGGSDEMRRGPLPRDGDEMLRGEPDLDEGKKQKYPTKTPKPSAEEAEEPREEKSTGGGELPNSSGQASEPARPAKPGPAASEGGQSAPSPAPRHAERELPDGAGASHESAEALELQRRRMEKLQNLTELLPKSQGFFSPKQEIRAYAGGFGIFARERIAAKTPLMMLPRRVVFASESDCKLIQSVRHSILEMDWQPPMPPQHMPKEYFFKQEYFKYLNLSRDVGGPSLWPDSATELLDVLTGHKWRQIHTEKGGNHSDNFVRCVEGLLGGQVDNITEAAYVAVATRSWTLNESSPAPPPKKHPNPRGKGQPAPASDKQMIDIEKKVIFPLADIYNHRQGHWTNVQDEKDVLGKRTVFSAARDIEAGEQLYGSYGSHPTAEVFRVWGFVEEYPRRWACINKEGMKFFDINVHNGQTTVGFRFPRGFSQRAPVGFIKTCEDMLAEMRTKKNMAQHYESVHGEVPHVAATLKFYKAWHDDVLLAIRRLGEVELHVAKLEEQEKNKKPEL